MRVFEIERTRRVVFDYDELVKEVFDQITNGEPLTDQQAEVMDAAMESGPEELAEFLGIDEYYDLMEKMWLSLLKLSLVNMTEAILNDGSCRGAMMHYIHEIMNYGDTFTVMHSEKHPDIFQADMDDTVADWMMGQLHEE